MSSDVKEHTEFILPPAIATKADVARLVREFEAVDNALTEKNVHEKVGLGEASTPPFSPHLEAFLEKNPVNLDDSGARSDFIKQLRQLKNNVRVMNMTFAATADPESLQKLTAWLREQVHPQTVIDVHLQPALVAGVYVRSQNHVFDFSVRNALKARREALKQELEARRG